MKQKSDRVLLAAMLSLAVGITFMLSCNQPPVDPQFPPHQIPTSVFDLPFCGNHRIDPKEECEIGFNCPEEETCVQCQCVGPHQGCETDEDCPQGQVCIEGQCVGSGDVRVTLTWGDLNDLDLHVIDPSGEEIYYAHRESASGGTLDIDANPDCYNPTYTPVENIFWPSGTAPFGTYTVKVNYYAHCDAPRSPQFVVETLVDGTSTLYPGVATFVSPCGQCDIGCECQLIITFVRNP
jgi:hypothetical protein